MPIRVEGVPDIDKARELMLEELGAALLDGADVIRKDATDRIKEQLTLDNTRQQQNTDKVRRRKQRKRGHTTPLRDTDILSNPMEYPVNGRIGPIQKAEHLRRIVETGKLRVIIQLPPERERIVGYLEKPTRHPWPYSVPFGISAFSERVIMNRANLAIRRAIRRFASVPLKTAR